MEKVDVIINVYGKPWQTLCALKSLMKHSGEHIDKIYLIEEKQQPFNANVKFILNEFDNVIHYIPKNYIFTQRMSSCGNLDDENNRYSFRYQYGIDNSDKDFVFILHNDILITGDIVGDMLNDIETNAGIGLIGQCWNCPAHHELLCDREKYYDYNPSYTEVMDMCKRTPPARGGNHNTLINITTPMPLPECRLNEFVCLINRNIAVSESYPNSNSPFFGAYDGLDLGDMWFRSLVLKNYRFKNYSMNKTAIHGYYTSIIEKYSTTGYSVQRDKDLYNESELIARNYYNEKLK